MSAVADPSSVTGSSRTLAPLAVVTAFATALMRPLENPDEGRYAEIPREMLAAHDWIVPHLNGLVYIEKPPLQYWLTAAGFRLFGEHAWVVRCLTVACGIAGIVLVAWYLSRTAGARTASLAVMILASSLLYVVSAQFVSLDMMLSTWLTGALVCGAWAQSQRDSSAARRLMLLCWLCIAAAVLTKGPIGLVIPAATLSIYTLLTGERAIWRHLRIVPGLSLLTVLVMPWFFLVSRRVAEFPQFFFLREHLERFATDEAHRGQPWWFFIAVFAIGMAPWIPSLIHAVIDRSQRSLRTGQFDVDLLMLIWAAFVLVFFSISHSKLPGYVLPAAPALAIFIARHPHSLTATQRTTQAVTALCGLGIFILSCLLFFKPFLHPIALLELAERRAFLAGTCIAGGVLLGTALLESRHQAGVDGDFERTRTTAIGWFVAITIALSSAGFAAPAYSGARLAESILADSTGNIGIVYQLEDYDQTLPFYLRRECIVVGYRGELDFGITKDPSRWIADRNEFERRWRAGGEAVAIMSNALFDELSRTDLPMRLVGRDGDRVAVARR